MPTNARSSSAAPVMLGYLYQARRALLAALERVRTTADFLVRFETLDDVVFEESANASELIQTKHHINRVARLTDASPDLWRTLEIWIIGRRNGSIPPETDLSLITTATAPEDAAASKLRASGRNAAHARQALAATAQTSTARDNQSAYEAFRQLLPDQQVELLNKVVVYDSSPDITDLTSELERTLFFGAPPNKLGLFLQRLEGWWLHRLISNLTNPTKAILSEELNAEIARLRHQFQEDNLPIDDDIMTASVDSSGFEDEAFVQQLAFIGIGNQRVFHAIRNYFRASEHRSRWVREDLVVTGELERYEQRLIEEWEVLFAKMLDDLGAPAVEEAKVAAAKAVYHWVETNGHPSIRPSVSEPSIARGTYQILANYPKLGWHPDWRVKLEQILEPRSEL